MKDLKIIAGINIAVLIIFTGISTLLNLDSHDKLGLTITLAFLIAIQVILNFVVSMVFFALGNANLGKSFLLSSGIVLLIGFSSCFGVANI